MEPAKQAALMICLQQSQVDLTTAKQEKEEQAKRAMVAEAKVAELRDIIHSSGSQNMQRIAELLTELRQEREDRDIEQEEHNQLRSDTQALRDVHAGCSRSTTICATGSLGCWRLPSSLMHSATCTGTAGSTR